jgi:hypothetical protein
MKNTDLSQIIGSGSKVQELKEKTVESLSKKHPGVDIKACDVAGAILETNFGIKEPLGVYVWIDKKTDSLIPKTCNHYKNGICTAPEDILGVTGSNIKCIYDKFNQKNQDK